MPVYHATFPGLQITRADFLFSHGISPSVAVVYAVGVDPRAAYGDFVWWKDNEMLMTFKDCAMDQSTMIPPAHKRGYRMRINLMDRRWKWRYKLIGGRYNARKSDSTVREDTKKTYKELIEIVLKELGETSYNIDLPEPDLEAPSVDWYRQRADLQLAWLCDRIGCLICLGLDNSIQIVPNGKGTIYPLNGLELEPAIDTMPSNYPKEVRATFAPTRFQMKVQLEAVGLETDGTVLPINDLSYKPVGGWTLQVPGVFNDVPDGEKRQLARDTVYRWYRVKNFAGGGLDLPVNEYTIDTIDDILPILDGLVVKTDNNYPQRPFLEGYFLNGDLQGINEEEAGFSRWDDAFVLDYQHGIVKLPYPAVYVEESGHQTEADLYLTCAFNARKDATAPHWEHEFAHPLPDRQDTGYGCAQVEQADMFRYVVQEYTEADPAGVDDNIGFVDEQGGFLARSHACHYQAVPQMSMQWNGIIPYPVWGNVHHMRWRVGGGPGWTWGGKNLEYRYMAPAYSESKRRHEVSRSLHL